MDRLDCFNLAAAQILQRLLESFPEPMFMDATLLTDEVAKVYPECNFGRGPGNSGTLVAWTMRFLIDEGYVRISGRGDGAAFAGSLLTSKALAALNQPLESLEPRKTIGRRIIEVGKQMAPEVATTLIGRLMGA